MTKKNCFHLLLILLLCMIGQNASAFDVEAANADGVTIYYNYINDGTELEVTSGTNSYMGVVNIPKEVTVNNQTLKVTGIEKKAFGGNWGVTSVTIPNSVTTIVDEAFGGTGITSITIPNSVTAIGEFAFGDCKALTSVYIGNGVTTIGKQAFRFCHELTSVTIGNRVTTIGDFAFEGCQKLASLTIPNSVTTIGKYAFRDCWDLASAVIGDGVTTIGDEAFKHCQSLSFLSIGSVLANINASVFDECLSLSQVELTSNEIVSKDYTADSSIGNYFGNQVHDYIIGEGVTAIGDYAFNGCAKLDISSTVRKMGKNVFTRRAAIEVICRATTIPETDEETFTSNNLRNSTLHVPEASQEAYRTTAPWSGFKNIVPITPTEVTAPIATQQPVATECYDLSGRRTSQAQRGVSIVKMSDGTTKKIVVK